MSENDKQVSASAGGQSSVTQHAKSSEPWWILPTKGPGENCGYIVKRLKDLPKLHKAVWKDDLQRVKTVLASLKKTMYMDYFDKEHRTALHFACARGHDGMVRAICGAGANPNIPDSNGATPIHKAVESGNCFSLQHLLDGGGDPNVADELGRSPLHIAAKTGDITSVNLLLERGAMIDAVEKDGLTTLHIATLNGEHDIVTLISEYLDTNDSDEDIKVEEDYEIISEMADSSYELFSPPSRLRRKGGSDISTPSSSVEDLPSSCLHDDSSDGLVIVDCESESSSESEYQLLFDTDDDSDSLVTISASEDIENDLDSSSSTEDTSLSGSSEEDLQESQVPPVYCQELEEQQTFLINQEELEEDSSSSSSEKDTESEEEALEDQSTVEEVEEVLVKYDDPYTENETEGVPDEELAGQPEESLDKVVKKIALLNSFSSLVADAIEVAKQHQPPHLRGNCPLYESSSPMIIRWRDVALLFLHAPTHVPTIPYLHALTGMTIALAWVDPKEIVPTDPNDPCMIKAVMSRSPLMRLIGLGVIRGVDSVQKVFYVSSRECSSSHSVARVNTIVLGNPEYPTFYYPRLQACAAQVQPQKSAPQPQQVQQPAPPTQQHTPQQLMLQQQATQLPPTTTKQQIMQCSIAQIRQSSNQPVPPAQQHTVQYPIHVPPHVQFQMLQSPQQPATPTKQQTMQFLPPQTQMLQSSHMPAPPPQHHPTPVSAQTQVLQPPHLLATIVPPQCRVVHSQQQPPRFRHQAWFNSV